MLGLPDKLTAEQFLERHWQRRPAMIRGALPGWESPLSPEELAGLALEEGVASRLILELGGAHPDVAVERVDGVEVLVIDNPAGRNLVFRNFDDQIRFAELPFRRLRDELRQRIGAVAARRARGATPRSSPSSAWKRCFS